jgi:ParB-like chromosome segregation protein Spo0J
MTLPKAITWLDMPEHHDYGAAEDYLLLVLSPRHAEHAVKQLREAKHTRSWKAKDVLRAAGLDGLGADNEGVAAKLAKIEAGKPLAPILVVQREDGPLVIADGYHRTSAAHLVDESCEVPAVEAHL